ncbi:unnamed protein product, partial [Medioppia subpectinata]
METEIKSVPKGDDNSIGDGTSLLATQCGTGAQKRQRKSTAPVLQRIRPISKRKKFKKSLGPDFLEPAELGMQYLRDTYEPKCDICSLTMFSSHTSLNVCEELLHCTNCDAKAHPSCVNVSEEEVVHKTQWQCHNCKLCSVCRQTDTNIKSVPKGDDNSIADGTSLLATQCGTGAQKRQRKSTAPVLQRIRPISKRKVSFISI